MRFLVTFGQWLHRHKWLTGAVLLLAIGYALPERVCIPVAGASIQSWHPQSFWYEPWGSSGVHKGIDIFARRGTAVLSTSDGIVVYTGELPKGGRVIVVLSPKWRLHYFAHLQQVDTSPLSVVRSGEAIARVGDTGNAKGKSPHLHYAIVRLLPSLWRADRSTQGYKKMFFVDPNAYLRELD